MNTYVKIVLGAVVGVVLVSIPLYCLSQKNAAELITETKDYIAKNEKEKAIETLDLAFKAADSSGDVGALMEIGDLYVGIDTSLQDKAMKAWTQAGKWKCK